MRPNQPNKNNREIKQADPEGSAGAGVVSRGIRELAEHLTTEAGKPGKDFGELVRRRRKEGGLAVEQREEVLPRLPARWLAPDGDRARVPARTAELDAQPVSWDEEPSERRLYLRALAAERRVRDAFEQLEEAEVRQEPGRRLTWYEAQYLHELATYATLSGQDSSKGATGAQSQ